MTTIGNDNIDDDDDDDYNRKVLNELYNVWIKWILFH